MNLRRQKGLTLIELLAVMAISSIIVYSSLKLFGAMFAANDFDRTRAHARLVMNATQAFYESHCGKGDNAQPTIALLVSEGHLRSTSVATVPIGGTLQPSIQWATGTKYSRILVSAVLPIGKSPQAYLKALGADRFSGQTIYWDEAPEIGSRLLGDEIIQNMRMISTGLCK